MPNKELATRYRIELQNMMVAAAGKKAKEHQRTQEPSTRTTLAGPPRIDVPELALKDPPACVAAAIDIGLTDAGRERGTNRNDVTLQLACFFKELLASKGCTALLTDLRKDEQPVVRSAVHGVNAPPASAGSPWAR